jgi:predicted phosphodiesterase
LKIGIISDIHSNIQALSSVFKDMENTGCDDVICLGDIVGYGANPAECIELLIEKSVRSVMGNHDAGVCQRISWELFNAFAKKAIDWTRERINKEHTEYLFNLPFNIEVGNSLFIHGALTSPFDYIKTSKTAFENLDILKEKYPDKSILFFGHSHVPFYCDGGKCVIGEEKRYRLDWKNEGNKYLINPGSVGQPRGGITEKACYCIVDNEKQEILFRRISYDIKAAAKAIIDNGLPEILAERLFTGY